MQILLKAIDKVTGPVKRFIEVSQRLQQQVVGTQRQLSNVTSTQRAIEAYRKLEKQLGSNAQARDKARRAVIDQGRAIAAIAAPTQKMLKTHVRAQAERSQPQANIRFLTKTTPPRQSSPVASSQSILGYIATVSLIPLTYPTR